jgi:hypothetical protein
VKHVARNSCKKQCRCTRSRRSASLKGAQQPAESKQQQQRLERAVERGACRESCLQVMQPTKLFSSRWKIRAAKARFTPAGGRLAVYPPPCRGCPVSVACLPLPRGVSSATSRAAGGAVRAAGCCARQLRLTRRIDRTQDSAAGWPCWPWVCSAVTCGRCSRNQGSYI